MKEKDAETYDALCAELWRGLAERETLIAVESKPAESVRRTVA